MSFLPSVKLTMAIQFLLTPATGSRFAQDVPASVEV
jgi:hypothetical protein